MQKSSNCDKLLAVKIDTKLIFNNYIKDLCRKAKSNLCTLGRITPYMGLGKKKNDFPLIWMFYSQSNDSKITRLHERCLRLIYSDKSSSYEKLSERDGSVSIHQKNTQGIQLKLWSKTLKDTSESANFK